jgi:hypothetical protein
MKTCIKNNRRQEEGTIIAYFILLLIAIAAITSVAAYVTHTTTMSRRRNSMVDAYEYITAGAVMACADLNAAFMKAGSPVTANLQSASPAYTLNTSLSTTNQKVFERTISDPFTNQTVNAQIWLPVTSVPTTAKIVTTAKVGDVSQTVTLNVKLAQTFPAAIISVNDGTTSTSVTKSTAQAGNVVINGNSTGPIVVDGNFGLAVLANGRVNYDTNYINPPPSAYSQTNEGTINQIPDYTSQGTTNSLFDIGRFVAVADHTTNAASATGNNHFTNLLTFINAAKVCNNTAANSMEGVVVVDVSKTDPDMNSLTLANIPNGINVRGTLLFNFLGSGWSPTSSKIIITAAVNVNPADLSGLVASNPSTYPSGFPAVYLNPAKNPTNINIMPYGYTNFMAGDDLPALVYSIGVVDLHGPLDISGAMYTPSYMEIENKQNDQMQYIKGCVIMGNGIYFENNSKGSTSIISYDANAVDSLATLPGMGKQLKVAYWQ